MKNADMPAMPPNAGWRDNEESARGVTKREYFAGLAMQALIMARPNIEYDGCAEEALLHAEYLIAEFEKGEL